MSLKRRQFSKEFKQQVRLYQRLVEIDHKDWLFSHFPRKLRRIPPLSPAPDPSGHGLVVPAVKGVAMALYLFNLGQ